MECFVSTQRSITRGSSKLKVGLDISNPRNVAEARSTNATLDFSHKANFQSKGNKIRALMSILVNVGFSTTFENQSSDNDNFGSSHSQPSNINGSVRFRSKGKLNINDWEGQGYIAPQPTVVANFGAVEKDGFIENSRSTVRTKNGKIRFWKICTENYCLPIPVALTAAIKIQGNLNNTYTDKIGGYTREINKLDNFAATQKFYPIEDIVTTKNNVSFVNKDLSASGLYTSVDEGLFVGNYTKGGKTSLRINDEYGTYITPSSIYSEGNFTYKCELTPPAIKPIENFLFIRAAAPMAVFESDLAPEFRIHNIRWEDPSGNLITKYKDIIVRGDGDFEEENEYYNFATYVTEPEYNNASRHNWDELVPVFGENSGYTLNMDFKATCFHDPFTKEFSKKSYENQCELYVLGASNDYLAVDGAPLSTQNYGFEFTPNASIRISNIEIVASGSAEGLLAENYAMLHAESVKEGFPLERKLYPSEVLPNDFSNGIHPEVNTIWKSSAHNGKIYYNNVKEDLEGISRSLNDFVTFRSIELVSTTPIADSGKLHLKYSHQPALKIKQVSGGAFSIGKLRLDSNLDLAKATIERNEEEYYEVESIELKLVAKKASSSTRDFALDIVGYCDDGLFNVTSAVDGFLQNSTAGVGTVPVASGFDNSNYLTRSSEAISSRDEYFENRKAVNSSGGDHYLITQSLFKLSENDDGEEVRTPSMVDSTEFDEYIVPLQVFPKEHELGYPESFKISPYFEALHLDIYPLPVGAVIAKAELIVKYKPSAGMHLHTFGYGNIELSRRSNNLFTAPMGERDHKLNAIVGSKPLSLIENIPHGFTTPETIKTNYSKRWRGVDGVSRSGPFNPPAFDESFYNPQLEKPFLNGYYTFSSTDGNNIYPDDGSTVGTGIFSALLSSNIINSVGMRFRTDHLFASQERSYTTIDWTSAGHELYGQITDSFENAVRVKQSNGNINFGNVACSGGFSIFARFSPDVDVSGVDYNLFNSGVIVSKWDAGKDLELAIGYKDGRITGYARDVYGNNIEVQDTLTYTDYQYPIPILLTYNDNESQSLRLYTDNEIINSGSFDILRSSSSPFVMASGDSDLVFGHSYGSGVGMNAFITDIGISQDNTYGAILVSGSVADASKQQTTAERFFDSFRSKFWNDEESYTNDRYKLWDFVDEDSNKWHIGAFKYCEFGPAYDTLTKKIGNDYIVHNFKTDGGSYENDTQLSLPNDIVTSGLAYHTQLENDMFRMHLSDVTDKFVAVAPRLSKALPTSYNPAKEALVVDTVVEHETTDNIVWPDGKIGPRLIVSLYTKTKETDLFENTNWGLLNRDIHYIGPKDCWQKLNSQFTLESIRDTETEPWANFSRSQLLKEREHYHESQDVNDMFVQYDLAYPSGSYDSTIRIHSSHVRIEDALHMKDVVYADDFNLSVSGQAIAFGKVDLHIPYVKDTVTTPSSGLSLYCSGLDWLSIDSSGVGYFGPPLFTSGTYRTDVQDYTAPEPYVPLYFHSVTGISVEPPYQFNLFTSTVPGWLRSNSGGSNNFSTMPTDMSSEANTFGSSSDPVLFGSSDDVEVDPLGKHVNLLLTFEDTNDPTRDFSGKFNNGSNHEWAFGDVISASSWTGSPRNYQKNFPTDNRYRNFGKRSLRIYDQSVSNYGAPTPQTFYAADFKSLSLDPKIWTSEWTMEFFIRITDPALETGDNELIFFDAIVLGMNDSQVIFGTSSEASYKTSARSRWYKLRDNEDYSTGLNATSSDGKYIGFNTVEAGMSLQVTTNVNDTGTRINGAGGLWLTPAKHSISFKYLSAIPEGVIRTENDFDNRYIEETCRAYNLYAPITPDYDNWNHVSVSAINNKICIVFNGVLVGEEDYFGWPDIEGLVDPDFLSKQVRTFGFDQIHPPLTLHSDGVSGAKNDIHNGSETYSYYLDDLRLTLGSSRVSVATDKETGQKIAIPSVQGQALVPAPPEGVSPAFYELPDPTVNAPVVTTTVPPPPPIYTEETAATLFLFNDQKFSFPYSEEEMKVFVRGVDEFGNNRNLLSNPDPFRLFVNAVGRGLVSSGGQAGGANSRVRATTTDFNLFVAMDRVESESGGKVADTDFNLYVDGYDANIVTVSGDMSLHTVNVSLLTWQNYLQSFTWDGQNSGTEIVIGDNDLLSLDADDEIRGVVTMCHSDCDNNGTCNEVDIVTHDTLWFSQICANGGVMRPKSVYTNPNVNGYNTVETGYNNNYYGVRKFQNLIPGSPYSIRITAKTGEEGILDVPKEIPEWGYGTSDEVDYSGIKIVPPDTLRDVKDHFGYSVDVVDDLMAIGVPNYDLVEHDGTVVTNAGSVFLYRRDPAPSGNDWTYQPDQSSWSLEAQLTLPTGYLVDTYEEIPKQILQGTGANAKVLGLGYERVWSVGQLGRELGYSVSVSKHNGQETVVAGAPGAKWNRQFVEAEPQPVNIALFVFTDEFVPVSPFPYIPSGRRRSLTPNDLLPLIRDKDIIFRYFSDPPVKFDVKIIICEGVLGTNIPAGPTWEDCPIPEPDFVVVKQVHRVAGTTESARQAANDALFSDLKDIYNEIYPQDATKQNNGQPAIMTYYVDTSVSFGSRAVGSTSNDSLEGNGGLERFVEWSKDQAYNNGLVDNVGNASIPSVEVTVGHNIQETSSTDENDVARSVESWYGQSNYILNRALDIDRLLQTGDYKLFATEGFGTFNTETPGFNIAPPSGGAVFVFNKYDDGWKVVQRIDSPTTTNDTHIDRFGHDVAISSQGNAIVVGSPYMSSHVRIYEKSWGYEYGNSFESRFIDWIHRIGSDDHLELREAKTSLLTKMTYSISSEDSYRFANEVYNNLSPSGQYTFRTHFNSIYYNYFMVKEITSDSINPPHTWSWLTSKYHANPRLGYSVDINEDGTLVAIGSPTDGLGPTDDGILWYKPGPKQYDPTQWFSKVNSGSVRVLQARRYYSHSKVMQYGAWGNLNRTIELSKHMKANNVDAIQADSDIGKYFNHFETIYSNMTNALGNIQYIETGFEDPEIPQDVGALFIITPEIDRLSKEYIDNIKNWLALGDRNLVLVGDDPIWETDENGNGNAYYKSNVLINRLLESLDSRMRLHPAANRYESMIDQDTGLYYNNIPSFRPDKTTHTYIMDGNMRASGVADIRLHEEGMYRGYDCSKPKKDTILQGLEGIEAQAAAEGETETYFDLHDRCNHVIKHEGDLRAEWSEICYNCEQKKVNYKVNIALMYGTHNLPGDYGCGCCSDVPCPTFPKQTYEPIPILAAAEKKIVTTIIPATNPSYKQEFYVTGYETRVDDPVFDGDTVSKEIEFAWTHDSGNYTYLNYNEFGTESNSLFFDKDNPILEQNNKNAILMARAEILEETEDYKISIQDTFPVCVEQEVGTNKSKIVVMMTTQLESQAAMSAGDDRNVLFYMNLLDKNENGEARVAQLGGWTGRTSFIDAYEDSVLASTFQWVLNYDVFENVQMSQINQTASQFDVLWIANAKNVPSDAEASQIRTWLAGGEHRKLVITVGVEKEIDENSEEFWAEGDDQIAVTAGIQNRVSILDQMLTKFESRIKPLYMEGKHKYADSTDTGVPSVPFGGGSTTTPIGSMSDNFVIDKFNTDFITGKRGSVSQLAPVGAPLGLANNTVNIHKLIALTSPFNTSSLLYFETPIVDKRTADTGTPFLRTGTARVDFPVEPEGQYRFYATFSSERTSEDRVLGFHITDTNGTASPPNNVLKSSSTNDLFEILNPLVHGEEQYGLKAKVPTGWGVDTSRQTPGQTGYNVHINNGGDEEGEEWGVENYSGRPYTYHTDFTIPTGVSGISVYIQGDYYGHEVLDPEQIHTQRLIAVSGAKIGTKTETQQIPIFGERTVLVRPGQPEKIITKEVIHEMSSDSSKYCPTDFCKSAQGYGTPGPEIHDGPVTVAQEIYHQAPFLSGYERSRITLISDASLIQGKNIVIQNEENNINGDLVALIRSLYPNTYDPDEGMFFWDMEGDGDEGTLQYESTLKLVSPEVTSPARLMSSEINSGFNNLFGGYTQTTVKDPSTHFGEETDNNYPSREWIPPMEPVISNSPSHTTPRSPMPPITDEAKKLAREGKIAGFSGIMVSMGSWCRFKTDINGVTYEDNGYGEGANSLMKAFEYDFLDLHEMSPHMSGYPGDLFGYKVQIHKGEIYVSSPFAAFSGQDITNVNQIITNSPKSPLLNAQLGFDGGAGSVYKFTQDNNGESRNAAIQTAWSPTKKFRPDTLSAGDQFGMSFDIDGDVIAISAPAHDGTANIQDVTDVENSGEFIRKEFNDQFDIPEIQKNDLPSGGSTNQGAVYTYENKISDWGSKSQDWVFIQKLIPQGYNAVNENDFFGRSVALDRNSRSDQDYALVVGSPAHDYGSGVASPVLSSGGAVYTYDAMLRRPAPSFSHPDTNIAGRIYGNMDVQDHEKYVEFDFSNGSEYDNNIYQNGVVFASHDGEIFIEASGRDYNPKGYVVHRPFIEEIQGAYLFGTFQAAYARLVTRGTPPTTKGEMNLIKPMGKGNVYNDIELRLNTFGVLGISDTDSTSDFNLPLHVSGSPIGSINNSGDPLGLYCELADSGVDEINLFTKGHFQPS